MKAAYLSGDIYMAFAVEAGAAPTGATKDTHPEIRELFKLVMLAVQSGQGPAGLERTLGKAEWQAKELLDLHRRVYERLVLDPTRRGALHSRHTKPVTWSGLSPTKQTCRFGLGATCAGWSASGVDPITIQAQRRG